MHHLSGIREWSPFKIDALGIITLLGASSLRKATGRLVQSPYAEYLPHLASHIYADNSIAETIPGFVLYNITDGVKATDLSSWFTCWLSCQDLCWQETTLEITEQRERTEPRVSWYLGVASAGIINTALIVLPILLGDWYGLASAFGVVLTIVTRTCVLYGCRRNLDRHVVRAGENSTDAVKLFVTLPSGKAVSVHTTRGITVECLLTEAQPENRQVHQAVRAVAWAGFALHAVALGMASLCMQLFLVAALLLPTVTVVQQYGCDEACVGRYLRLRQINDMEINTRSKAYVKLDLSSLEEDAMVGWNLFPMKTNHDWYKRYRDLQTSQVSTEAQKIQPQWHKEEQRCRA